MALKALKPTTSTRRHTVVIFNKAVAKVRGTKSLMTNLKYAAGRNASGRITVRHKGGRVRKHYRMIDFMRDKKDVPAVVETIEYDPNRSSYIALVLYKDGERRYIIAPDELKIGDEIVSGENVEIKVGNAMPLSKIPSGMYIHNVEIHKGQGAIIGRSAGTKIQLQGGSKGYIQLKMPSGEIRLVKEDCYATIGSVSNSEHSNQKFGKAGRKRLMGIRPTVRGVAQSGGKHPHGDGQGKSGRHGPGGPAKDKWGNRVGTRTRKNKVTNKFIVNRRPVRSGRKYKAFKSIV
jgi:large subunit ribosomal protein L2